ncbi:PP170 [Orf virus]|uniref:PP170 n=1 Tax=Orf virus TaxID=10258 RepID=F1AX02_ORFV|nr:PP170 [Orf virus]
MTMLQRKRSAFSWMAAPLRKFRMNWPRYATSVPNAKGATRLWMLTLLIQALRSGFMAMGIPLVFTPVLTPARARSSTFSGICEKSTASDTFSRNEGLKKKPSGTFHSSAIASRKP